ncbi:MAG: DUF3379 family protein [Colwellia sp.]
MDDLQFRRVIYANPKDKDVDILAAQQQDMSKRKFVKELCQLDEKIKRILEIPVPDDLYNKLILRQTLAAHQIKKRRTRFYLALVASVAIFSAVGFNFIQFSSAYDNLGDYALAHVYHEQGDFNNNASKQLSLTSLNKKMATFEGRFSQSIGKLLFADYCRFDGMRSLHLVYQGKTSPVTVFVVPKNKQLSFSRAFHDEHFFGSALAFNDSNILIVADKNESLEQWRESISETVTWTI